MKVYKVIIQEISSLTAYINARDEDDARKQAIFSDINGRDNQDLEQTVIRVEPIDEKNIPIGIQIN
jgi:hypothetical protein